MAQPCKRCIIWSNLEWLNEHSLDARIDGLQTLEYEYNYKCLLCQAIKIAVSIQRPQYEMLRVASTACIVIKDRGPYFLVTDGVSKHAFCKQVLTNSGPKTIAIRLIWKLDIFVLPEDWKDRRALGEKTDAILLLVHHFATITPQLCLRYSRALPFGNLVSVDNWEVPYFKVSLIKKWVQSCQEGVHGLPCADYRHQVIYPPDFRVIDVNAMKLVVLSEYARFVALSYMWEDGAENSNTQLQKNNLAMLEVSGGISKISLPNRISDAISLCRDLGEDYLWVDRLCIIQDDALSKHGQICAMDKIYSSAAFTIIIALDQRDRGGIPGVNRRPRYHTNGDGESNSSLWNKRGWTFQERLLSKRRLFITEFQVIYECPYGQAHEELTYYSSPWRTQNSIRRLRALWKDGKAIEERDHQEYRRLFGFVHQEFTARTDSYPRNISSFPEYCSLVADYSQRQLSFESDILNAFVGVANSLGSHLHLNTPMLFGLPARFLPQALMWVSLSPSEQGLKVPSQFPSWSWTSEAKHIDYLWIGSNSDIKKDVQNILSLVYFHFQDPDLGLQKVDTEERWMEEKTSIMELASNQTFPPLVTKEDGCLSEGFLSAKTWAECPHNPRQCQLRQALDPVVCELAAKFPNSLIFNTTVASLRIYNDPSATIKRGDKLYQNVIRDKTGRKVGIINRRGRNWIDTSPELEQEFLVICASPLDLRPRSENFISDVTMPKHWDRWRLHVLMIKRVDGEANVARRIDAGWIRAHKWKEYNPRWETIVLI